MATPNTCLRSQPDALPLPADARLIRTLLVDDAPGMLEIFASVLAADPRIDLIGTTTNGLSAVAVALLERPELIIMDINMPKMNGLKAAMYIKLRLPETKIILMSADNDPETALAAMDCGADGFLPKALWSRYAWHVYRLFLR